MAAIRYKFTRVEVSGGKVLAFFEKGTSGFWGLFGSAHEIWENEKGCNQLYKEACVNTDNSRGGYASANSKEDASRAFHAIRLYCHPTLPPTSQVTCFQ